MKILGYDYEIDLTKNNEEIGASGRMHSVKQLIQIASNNTQQQAESTLLHEIIESLNYHLDLTLEHNKIMSLEAGLYQTLTDNGIDLSPLLKGAKK
jgi:hypothetical protein